MTPMCNSVGVQQGWAVGVADCENDVTIEYFDVDGVSEGFTLPVGWKPCVQGETGPEWVPTHETLVYASIVDIDFSSDEYKTLIVTGDLELTGSNYTAASEIRVLLWESGSTPRSLTFPVSWGWVGDGMPTSMAASDQVLLTLIAFGTTEASVMARWEVATV